MLKNALTTSIFSSDLYVLLVLRFPYFFVFLDLLQLSRCNKTNTGNSQYFGGLKWTRTTDLTLIRRVL